MLLRLLGPGLVTGAADDDPSGIATYSQAGAQFGYGLLWTVFLTTPFMIAIQLVSARIGRVTGKGLAANVMELAPRWLVLSLVFLLVAANTFNIAADIAAMGEALSLVIGGLNHEHALIFAATSTLLQVFVPYRRYAPVLKFMTLTLFAYVATALTVKIPWSTALLAAVRPTPTINANYFLMVVAVLGTTISPYLFFWQASQEVEEMNQGRVDRPLRDLVKGGEHELDRIRVDTIVGMIFSNVIAFSIILTTAAVLNAHGAVRTRHHRHRHAGDPGAGRLGGLWGGRSVRMARHPRSQGSRGDRILHHHRRGDRDRIWSRLYRNKRHSHAGVERRAQRYRCGSDHGDDDGDRRQRRTDGTVSSQVLADRTRLGRHRADGRGRCCAVWVLRRGLEVWTERLVAVARSQPAARFRQPDRWAG
jgi:hypothetical protein